VNGWLGGKSKRSGVKFQQHNSSSKNGDQMRRGGVSFIPKRQREGPWMAAKCWQSSKRETLEGGALLGFC
jgi:hypothetical protein